MGSFTEQRRRTSCVFGWIKFALLGIVVSFCFQGALCEVEPTESQCRSHIEKALKEQHIEGYEVPEGHVHKDFLNDQEEFPPTDELTDSTEGSITNEEEGKVDDENDDDAVIKRKDEDDDGNKDENEQTVTEDNDDDKEDVDGQEEPEVEGDEKENDNEMEQVEDEGKEEEKEDEVMTEDDDDDDDNDNLEKPIDIEVQEVEMGDDNDDDVDDEGQAEDKGGEEKDQDEEGEKIADEQEKDEQDEKEDDEKVGEEEQEKEEEGVEETEKEDEEDEEDEEKEEEKEDEEKEEEEAEEKEEETTEADVEQDEDDRDAQKETVAEIKGNDDKEEKGEEDQEEQEDREDGADEDKVREKRDTREVEEIIEKEEAKDVEAEGPAESEAEEVADQETPEEEELIQEMVIPDNLRPRDHIEKILRLEDSGVETVLEKTIDVTLKALKALYDNAIKPLEMLYKYRDLSNRHFGDPEIFSKPLILFMGPWSGGKSSTINYLLDNEFSRTSLKTGAEPSPAYFNILMHGEEEEILDGTQLAADWTFSGLQKFGQGLLDRLKGIKLPNKLLEKVNIVEIPGILEIRKQVQRLFPFNDACQWFIDRADIIFLVYDPSKLDVGPETEAILDQLKGREYQTRIILNKADQVKPEELMRVQGTLIWNISPLMSSSEPPIMYSTSLWSLPYEIGAPTRLLQAQERAFLRDLREAIDKRVEHKISSARRFAVRVRNHAKMVDCYLTTYYNHKTIFGNRKKISDDIIEYPQKYHIYEGLSTLTNISRYDLPDPDVYRDFFKINPLYEFKKLSETCTYFRGCPINKLDVAIAYDLPELVGKYRKAVEAAKEQLQKENS